MIQISRVNIHYTPPLVLYHFMHVLSIYIYGQKIDSVIYFNGEKIKFRGVNRHDSDPETAQF